MQIAYDQILWSMFWWTVELGIVALAIDYYNMRQGNYHPLVKLKKKRTK